MTTRSSTEVDRLTARSAAFVLLARMLGPDTRHLVDESTHEALRELLQRSADDQALACLDPRPPALDPDQLAGRWVRWFDLGRVAPYEGSNTVSSAGGVTPRLADVAGFYRAFGVAVSGDRPDHVVAELEFLAVALLLEAEARRDRDAERRDVVASAVRSFLRDHAGIWIDTWAARIAAVEELAPWAPVAATAAALVAGEAARRNVVPVHAGGPFLADSGVAQESEALLACGEPAPD